MIISSVVSGQNENVELRSILLRPYQSKQGRMVTWVFRYARKEITQHYPLAETQQRLRQQLGIQFGSADLYCSTNEYFLKTAGRGKLTARESAQPRKVEESHDKQKTRTVDASERFLQLLGVTSPEGHVKKDKRDKYIQINKFLEFFGTAVQSLSDDSVRVLDMGSGKGYLTFAMYHFLERQGKSPRVTGVEFRQDMVDLCNALAAKAGFTGLGFAQGTIEGYAFDGTDVVIALHACDTATDEALYKGIVANARVIMVAPCCHKQIRRAMAPTGPSSRLLRNGIIEERLAEMLTDVLRAEILEIYGYQTQIFEFVNADHTPKNLMITAIKKRESQAKEAAAWENVEALKTQYGISRHHLQGMLKEKN